ncbi:MAG: ATP-binding protein, partial [Clostridia bacterium]|nr:ATP-binding protein [Clostridia bacterium]
GENLTERQLEQIARAVRACRRTESIIGGIRAFTRGARSDKTAVDIYDVAREAFEMVERLSSPKIGFHIDLVPGRYLVLGNADLLYQVFVNLGVNAAQAIEERGVHAGDYINMTAKHVSIGRNELAGLDPGGYIRINVEDNGVGMTETVKSRIFEPLFSTKRKQGKGQGLGLAMVHNIIIKDHGGAINIDSEYGSGTVFHIYLPDASKGNTAEKGSAYENAADLVLVVVDDADVSEFTGEILKMRGYRVLAASSSSEGIVMLRKHTNDAAAAIIDADIKDSVGRNALEAILKTANGTRIVLLTTGEKPLPASACKISAVLRKPFTVDTLAHAVRRALDK